jgi:hypothetical protein
VVLGKQIVMNMSCIPPVSRCTGSLGAIKCDEEPMPGLCGWACFFISLQLHLIKVSRYIYGMMVRINLKNIYTMVTGSGMLLEWANTTPW